MRHGARSWTWFEGRLDPFTTLNASNRLRIADRLKKKLLVVSTRFMASHGSEKRSVRMQQVRMSL